MSKLTASLNVIIFWGELIIEYEETVCTEFSQVFYLYFFNTLHIVLCCRVKGSVHIVNEKHTVNFLPGHYPFSSKKKFSYSADQILNHIQLTYGAQFNTSAKEKIYIRVHLKN